MPRYVHIRKCLEQAIGTTDWGTKICQIQNMMQIVFSSVAVPVFVPEIVSVVALSDVTIAVTWQVRDTDRQRCAEKQKERGEKGRDRVRDTYHMET